MTYADIIVDISHEKLDKSFQYLVPEKLKEEIQVGMVVSIPFGKFSEREGRETAALRLVKCQSRV